MYKNISDNVTFDYYYVILNMLVEILNKSTKIDKKKNAFEINLKKREGFCIYTCIFEGK
jgi:hypothetical protein